MKIAVEGCCHGEMDKIYEVLSRVEEEKGYKIDLLICCGDLQTVRNAEDLNCMAVPMKYKFMQSFYKYYSGEKKAPILTIFIGGNHEASNYLWELSYGGWVAPNIYYLGNAGVIKYGGLRIAGLSGIYKPHDYEKNRFECPPYNPNTVRSAYHVRTCDVFRLRQLTGAVDIGLSHDWPLGIYEYGDKELLLRLKPFFGEEMATHSLGSPAAMDLMQHLQPSFWFSGHLHVKFAAVYRHRNSESVQQVEPQVRSEDSTSSEAMESQDEGGKQDGSATVDKEESDIPEGHGDNNKDITVSEAIDEDKEPDDSKDVVESKAEVAEGGKESPSDNGECSQADMGGKEDCTTTQSSESAGEVKNVETEVAGNKEVSADSNGDDSAIVCTPANKPGSVSASNESGGKITKFLALDKVMPRKRFLQILDIGPSEDMKTEPPYRLEYDAEWLAILKSTEPLMNYKEGKWVLPAGDHQRTSFTPTAEELLDIQQRFSTEESNSHFYIPENFAVTVPAYVENEQVDYNAVPKARENPQTVEFCAKLGIDNPFNPAGFNVAEAAPEVAAQVALTNPEEINVDEEEHHCHTEEKNEDTGAASRPPLVLPPPANSQCADNAPSEIANPVSADSNPPGEGVTAEERSADGEGSTDPANCGDKEPGADEDNVSPLQSLKRSLSDRSPARLNAEENNTAEDTSVDNTNKTKSKQGDEPLIKRRNVALYAEEAEETAEADE